MDNEPIAVVTNGDNTDTHSQINGTTDNASRHSSRTGSARSGRSKAASVREAVVIDDLTERKPSATAAGSPKPDVTTNGDRQPSTAVQAKPPSPVVPVFDSASGVYNDDLANQDDDYLQAEIEAIVSLNFHGKYI
jgi:hypothetical protein